MALGFRSASAFTESDVGPAGGSASVATPAGFASGDLLLILAVFDCNNNPATPAGWTAVALAHAGTSAGSVAYPVLAVYKRIATGSETAVNLTWAAGAWPAGDPNVTACMLAYTGADATNPVDQTSYITVGGNVDQAQLHPQVTTSTANTWLVTCRARSGNSATFASSVGTDVSRAADVFLDVMLNWFDSNTPLAAGTQTQRTTTGTGTPGAYGDVMLTLVLKPAAGGGGTAVTAGVAAAVGSAKPPSTVSVSGAWDSCSTGTLPAYTWAVDWNLSGQAAAGSIMNPNPYVPYDVSGWTGFNSTIVRSVDLLAGRTVPCTKVTPNGSSAAGGLNASSMTAAGTVIAGQTYIADCWVYCPNGWTDVCATADFYTAGGSYVDTILPSVTAVAAGNWVHFTNAMVAPATSSRAVARFRYNGTPPASTVFYVFGLVLMDPTQAEDQITPAPSDVIGTDMLAAGATWSYGRDQMRQISPAAIGQAAFNVNNSHRVYSPEYVSSPLAGTLDAARPMASQVVFNGTVYPLFSGRINDYDVHVARGDRTVAFTFLDLESAIQKTPVTTALYSGIRTGDAINIILDAVGWTGPRDIDPGASLLPWWWLTNVNASDAINDLVLSDGPPSIAYGAPDGTFVFRDRTHRLLRSQSLNVQGSYAAGLVDCASPAPSGFLHFTDPLTYAHGWRDIINTVNFSVGQRAPDGDLSAVWTATGTLAISTGQTVTINVSTTDPFLGAVVPVAGTDYTTSGGTLNVTLGQTSGSSTTLALQAVGADTVVTGLQLRAYPVPVVQTTIVQRSDTASIGQHGSQAYPNQAPWAGLEDAYAIAGTVLLRYAQRRPLVQIRVVAQDPVHYLQILERTVSDLIHIRHDELGMDSDFYVEHLAHTAQRMDWSGRPPVHAVVLGCEEQVYQSTNPFTFDLKGAGFDQGIFDPPSSDNPANVFVFDDPVRGVFDIGVLGT